jgi:hypothetical protein
VATHGCGHHHEGLAVSGAQGLPVERVLPSCGVGEGLGAVRLVVGMVLCPLRSEIGIA